MLLTGATSGYMLCLLCRALRRALPMDRDLYSCSTYCCRSLACYLSCGDVGDAQGGNGDTQGISALPDELLHKILINVRSRDADMPSRTTLPLVCKKWREVLFLQGVHQPLLSWSLRRWSNPYCISTQFRCIRRATSGVHRPGL